MDPSAALHTDPSPDPEHDPEGRETRALREAVSFAGARVLEIGSGDGRLTARYARTAGRVVGVDLDAGSLAEGRRSCPPALVDRLRSSRADACRLPFRGGSFDIALLAWSL